MTHSKGSSEQPQAEKARVFQNGRSQAVRIPKAYRFSTDEVYIRRDALTGELVLSEKPSARSLRAIFDELDAAGAADFTIERDPSPSPERDWFRASLHLLDTNIVTYIVDGCSPAARDRMEETITHSSVAVSAIIQAKILYGLERKPGGTRLRLALSEFFGTVRVLPWTSTTAQSHDHLRARLASKGKNLSAIDMLIAAHAAEWNATLVTHDKAFSHADHLIEVDDWATDLPK